MARGKIKKGEEERVGTRAAKAKAKAKRKGMGEWRRPASSSLSSWQAQTDFHVRPECESQAELLSVRERVRGPAAAAATDDNDIIIIIISSSSSSIGCSALHCPELQPAVEVESNPAALASPCLLSLSLAY
ncbi:hypothetical protein AXG93_2189s1190 [Marchantia polymorpha subsp. ruderalis]|uniref:Uncharacterized protein n=1 Tax=Marchantia polymorpha subsp. ruderalis TaxID=1480154 RepID=A0A176WSJ1_MARPO|nr:hypothetical protein AXG93_2189s1190 [Marchantia polymorpha subsp. ruderalis]